MKTNIINDFLIFVIEEYKYLENKNAKDTIEIFTNNLVFDYVMKHYDILHTMGGRAIIDDINLFIKNHKN
ncbi:MAG: DUF3791 domain-containing protein [Treponema sp.]|nr:DUF3791 domain-containing protein [Treponema sp.]